MAQLGGLEEISRDERLVSGPVEDDFVVESQPQLAEIDAVPDHLRSPGRPAAEDPSDHTPWSTSGASLEGGADYRSFIRRLEAAFRPLPVSDRRSVGRPDPALDGLATRPHDLGPVPIPLHPGEREEEVAREAPFGSRRVDVLGDGDHLATGGLDPSQDGEGVTELHSRESVDLRDDDPGELTPVDPLQRPLEDRALDARPAHVELGRQDLDLEATDLGEPEDALLLELGRDQALGAIADPGDSSVPRPPQGGQSSTLPTEGESRPHGLRFAVNTPRRGALAR